MHRVLAVDDSPISCQIYAKVLSPYCKIDTVESAEDALLKLSKSAYDLVISDVNLPGMSGIELITQIKQLDINPEIKFIVISADGDSIADAKDCLVKLWLLKPIKPSCLLNAVQKLLN